MQEKSMKWFATPGLACLLVFSMEASAQEVSRPGGVTSGGGRAQQAPNAPYTGINPSGRPVFTGGRGFRWADFPVIRSVDEGSPAAKVGIQSGDVILRVNGADGRDPAAMLGDAGKVFVLRLRRGDTVREYEVVSIRLPSAPRTGGH
jgi:S1-C subfamily serine protease